MQWKLVRAMKKQQADAIDQIVNLAPRLEEGDIATIGDIYRAVESLDDLADFKNLRDILTQLTTAEGDQFRQLYDSLQQVVGEIHGQLTDGGKTTQKKTSPQMAQSEPQPVPPATKPSPPAQSPAAAILIEETENTDEVADFIDKDLFLEFVEESLSHLQTIELNILSLETDPDNRTFIDNVFRPFHTIKGVSGFLNLKVIHFICHALENLLDDARNGQMRITGPISDLVLDAVDLLKNMIETCRSAESPAKVMSDFREEAQAFAARIASARAAAVPAPEPEGSVAAEIAEQQPAADPEPPPILGSILVESNAISPEVLDEAVKLQETQDGTRLGEILVHEKMASPKMVANALRRQTEAKKSAPEESKRIITTGDSGETIRVRISLLNQLMNLAGELVLGRNQLLQTLAGHSDQIQGLNAVLQHVDRVTSEVQEAVMQTRMQPIGGLFSRFHRVARDLARSLGKEIDLTISGDQVELDKSLIEALSDPLTHIIRNCADHGIEDPKTREAHGKPATGHISLRALQEGGKVRVIVSDDGAGVNLERVRAKALESGLVDRDTMQKMSDKETLRLLFEPGFSTAQAVTGVSGRGVGMDVVRQNVEGIGGTIDIETVQGGGTTISLDLPLTLAIIPALIVLAGDLRFAIPQINLMELVHLEGEEAMRDLMHISGSSVYRLRGEMLPLLRLSDVLELEPNELSARQDALSIAVLASGQTQFGLVIDRIYDTEEIVVKPLGNLLKNLTLYAGATLMGDGRPALILDVAGLANKANISLTEDQDFGVQGTKAAEEGGSDEQSILLFTVNPDDQYAVPLSQVSRLEKVDSSEIRQAIQGKVIPYRDTLLPLVFLEDLVDVRPPPEDRSSVTILVFDIEREVGLVVTEIVDSVEVSVQIDSTSLSIKGFTGMSLVQDRPTAFLDIYQIIESAFPEWFNNQKANIPTSNKEDITILLVEDSSFYRTVEKNYLSQEGFTVLEAEDGLQALKILKSQPVDLVVTDIEMPNMNGFELTRQVRATAEWNGLPIIAVTSMAKEEDREEGKEAGIDSYLVKLRREDLINEVYHLLPRSPRQKGRIAS